MPIEILIAASRAQNVGFWNLSYVHADRYFGRYRGQNGHTASTGEPTRLTHFDKWGPTITAAQS